MTSFEVRILVGLGLGRESSIRRPEVNQWLHGFQLLGLQQVEGGSGKNEVTEAAVQLLLEVEVVERLGEMCPVEMGIDPEHLQEDGLADVEEVLGESASLSYPSRPAQ